MSAVTLPNNGGNDTNGRKAGSTNAQQESCEHLQQKPQTGNTTRGLFWCNQFCNLLQQTERSSANPEKSPPKKKRPPSKPSMVEPADLFDATTAGASREVSMLFSKLAEVLSERATADTSQIKQLDGILRETQNLESYLREKKNHLRQKLALISNKLQG
ncbi:testis-expressed protein 12-like isoform X2 [Notolabrus celidotus]|uniref:testis-expressed protein 12-like isoform X2 n=1 Tax=Notolabrus celidotus TaxID=1203425 RepID=UPI0014900DBB|nr:testis-expressed protein 12-like isoform X2 [Notolabrus celidotus]